MGKRGNILEKEGIKKCVTNNNGLDDMVGLDKKGGYSKQQAAQAQIKVGCTL
jgi:hypothetical protein